MLVELLCLPQRLEVVDVTIEEVGGMTREREVGRVGGMHLREV